MERSTSGTRYYIDSYVLYRSSSITIYYTLLLHYYNQKYFLKFLFINFKKLYRKKKIRIPPSHAWPSKCHYIKVKKHNSILGPFGSETVPIPTTTIVYWCRVNVMALTSFITIALTMHIALSFLLTPKPMHRLTIDFGAVQAAPQEENFVVKLKESSTYLLNKRVLNKVFAFIAFAFSSSLSFVTNNEL